MHGIDVSKYSDRIIVDERGCWIWQKALNAYGYGVVTINYETKLVHRLIYSFAYGEIDSSVILHHECHVRACVNPWHLAETTRSEHRSMHGLLGAAAVHAAKTHCDNGHVLIQRGRQRSCLECPRTASREWARRNRESRRGRIE